MDRRTFFNFSGFAAGGLALSFCGFLWRAETLAETGDPAALRAVGYGELFPAAAKNTGETLLTLPKGFEYNVFGVQESVMSDGHKTPRKHDGMATFKNKGELRIVRNHEISNGKLPVPGSAIGANPYDESAGGGTTTLVIDPKTRELKRDFVSLSGTLINCAGGATPWGSWISCEETTIGPTKRADGTGGFAKQHGYCFEVFASANNPVSPVPLTAMGRFTHEAVAVDKKSDIFYLTEDAAPLPGGFYRFLPNKNKKLAEGGRLEMLAITDRPNLDMRTGRKQGLALPTHWVVIDNPDPAEADVDISAVYKQGIAKGGAIFAKLEGCHAAGDGRIYFISSDGGDIKGGQIWLYEAENKEQGRLTLVYESTNRDVLDMPDNVCIHHRSGNLFLCEDSAYVGVGGTADNYVRILTPDGKVADFAKNIVPAAPLSETAGATFSPDGKTLFFNVQDAGMTFAVWGDWDSFRV